MTTGHQLTFLLLVSRTLSWSISRECRRINSNRFGCHDEVHFRTVYQVSQGWKEDDGAHDKLHVVLFLKFVVVFLPWSWRNRILIPSRRRHTWRIQRLVHDVLMTVAWRHDSLRCNHRHLLWNKSCQSQAGTRSYKRSINHDSCCLWNS